MDVYCVRTSPKIRTMETYKPPFRLTFKRVYRLWFGFNSISMFHQVEGLVGLIKITLNASTRFIRRFCQFFWQNLALFQNHPIFPFYRAIRRSRYRMYSMFIKAAKPVNLLAGLKYWVVAWCILTCLPLTFPTQKTYQGCWWRHGQTLQMLYFKRSHMIWLTYWERFVILKSFNENQLKIS